LTSGAASFGRPSCGTIKAFRRICDGDTILLFTFTILAFGTVKAIFAVLWIQYVVGEPAGIARVALGGTRSNARVRSPTRWTLNTCRGIGGFKWKKCTITISLVTFTVLVLGTDHAPRSSTLNGFFTRLAALALGAP